MTNEELTKPFVFAAVYLRVVVVVVVCCLFVLFLFSGLFLVRLGVAFLQVCSCCLCCCHDDDDDDHDILLFLLLMMMMMMMTNARM